MRAREQNIDRFDAYLKGELSHKERSAFEKELDENEALKIDFEAYKVEVNLIKALGIREEMKSLMDLSEASENPMRKWRYLIPVGMAAALIFVLIFLPGGTTDNQLLFEKHFEPYPDAISGRNGEMDIEKAMSFYALKDYQMAIQAFNDLAESDTTHFYRGLSYLGIQEPIGALRDLGTITEGSLFYESAVWYKGLAFLLQDRGDSVVYYLNRTEINKPEARSIIKTLQKPD